MYLHAIYLSDIAQVMGGWSIHITGKGSNNASQNIYGCKQNDQQYQSGTYGVKI